MLGLSDSNPPCEVVTLHPINVCHLFPGLPAPASHLSKKHSAYRECDTHMLFVLVRRAATLHLFELLEVFSAQKIYCSLDG